MAKKGRKKKNLRGMVFGKLTVLGVAESDVTASGRRFRQWRCRCECGQELNVRSVNLMSGNTTSCGCSRRGELYDVEDSIMESVQRIHSDRTPQDPWHRLAGAIVAAAADDYRVALRSGNKKLTSSVEAFFRSDWYRVLTTVEPEGLMRRLRRESEEELAVACG